MLGKEVVLVPRPIKTKPQISVAWAFPNSYEIGMASLGYQLVWWLLEQDLDLDVSRVFTNCAESNWQESELVGFTLSWELDFINVLSILKKCAVSPLSSDRTDTCPIVFGGGPALAANPETFADIFDLVLLGDAEAVIPDFLAAWKEIRQITSRQEKLLRLSQIPGIYVPSLYQYKLVSNKGPIESVNPVTDGPPAKPTKRVFDPPADYAAHTLILAPESTWANLFCIEVVRSCPQECRFCLASFLTRPFRASSVETLLQKIDLGLAHTKKIGLLGPSVTEHPKFDQLAEGLMARPDTDISIASVRVDSLNATILNMLHTLGQKSVTMAIESGSERLRTIMKKNLKEEQIWQAVDLIDKTGLSGLKFYGIVGLPEEEDADLQETVRLLTQLKKQYKRLHHVFGVSSFVPKAQTPFQWAGRDRKSGEKLEYVRKNLAKLGIEVRPESHNWSDIQALLSRGDRRLTPLLLQIADGKGNVGAWRQALRNMPENCPDADYYIYRNIPYEETLPWSHLVDEPKAGMLLKHSHTAEQLAGEIPVKLADRK
jgi:radical SAM superfamily enzyme YgiQ (UPF0313 family)